MKDVELEQLALNAGFALEGNSGSLWWSYDGRPVTRATSRGRRQALHEMLGQVLVDYGTRRSEELVAKIDAEDPPPEAVAQALEEIIRLRQDALHPERWEVP